LLLAVAVLSAPFSWLALLLPVWLGAPPPGLPTAVGMRADQVLLGTERGLYREASSGWTLVLGRGGVRDLAYTPRGTLIATAAGLYEWPLDASAPRALLLGSGARVHSVAVDREETVWVASEVGLFARTAGERAFQRRIDMPTGEATAVRALAGQVWVATRRTLWVGGTGGEFEARLRGLKTGWWELNGAVRADSRVLLCVPRGLWSVGEGGADKIELGVGSLRGIALAQETLWVASERGVYAFSLRGLSSTGSSIALDSEALAVELASRGLLVATRRGVAVLPVGSTGGGRLALKSGKAGDPDVHTVQRAVLAYLELSPVRIARLDARARGAALYPQVRATFSLDRDLSHESDRDQTFSSGSVRDLFGRDSEHGKSLGLDVQLVWDLGKLAAPDPALSVSRERRQLIELRDQVLERVNRLYFERLRMLARLAALPPERAEERVELELRIRELAAQLDAWTGGMFSQLASGRPASLRRR
jgi:hypothetical protein